MVHDLLNEATDDSTAEVYLLYGVTFREDDSV